MLGRFVVRILLTAVVFCYIFPVIAKGVQFHGAFWPTVVIYTVVFAIISYLIGLVLLPALKLALLISVGTGQLGISLGIWAGVLLVCCLAPAVELKLFAHYFPQQLTIASWGSALWGGLILTLVDFMMISV